MNAFDTFFFTKYVHEGETVVYVEHKHIILMLDNVFLLLFFWVILPAFFYFHGSLWIKHIPFWIFEVYLIGIYLTIYYQVFDWYNDVWIITDKAIVYLDWTWFTTNIAYVDINDVKGIDIKEDTIIDGLVGKGDLVIHTGTDDDIFLYDAYHPHAAAEMIRKVIANISVEPEPEAEPEISQKEGYDLFAETMQGVIQEHMEQYYPYKKPKYITNTTADELKKQLGGAIDIR